MVNTYELNENITVLKNDILIKDSQKVYFKKDINSFSLQITLGGESEHKSLICDYKGKNIRNHTCVDLLNTYEGYVNIFPNKKYQFIEILIKKNYLNEVLPKNKISEKVLDFFSSSKNGLMFCNKKTNIKTNVLAQNIFNTQLNNNLEKLFLESKVLELLYIEFNNIFVEKEQEKSFIKFSSFDKEAIYKANEILSKNISNPPSIKKLSRMVAINELKLKTGFHKYFNQTPYKLSIEYRLQEARKLLKESEYNVNEVANRVGYKYVQSFSNAFYERFGIRPKDIMKTRKYYY